MRYVIRMYFLIIGFAITSLLINLPVFGLTLQEKGIYINESTMNNAAYLQGLINRSKEVGINTFIIDYQRGGGNYQQNIKLVNQSGIKYVARIVMFPNGGTDAQILSQTYWEQKYQLVAKAIELGAKEIQLDYIRYETSQHPSPQNAKNIYQVIKWFKNKLQPQSIPLQVDVFGVAAFGNSLYIGQNLILFADSIDAVCPMLYPSHFEPYRQYAKMPYYAIKSSLDALRHQFFGNIPFKVYPFIETYNYRYPLSNPERVNYITKQLLAAEDSRVDGFYVWNPHNSYNNLFIALKQLNHK